MIFCKKRSAATAPELRDHGQIARMTLPPWPEVAPRTPTRGPVKRYQAPGDGRTRLLFSRTATPLPSAQAALFASLLRQAPFRLRSDHLWDLVALTHDMPSPDYFQVDWARTETWNGRAVMIIEGLWKSDGEAEFHMFAGTDDPEFVDQICFIGPREDFARHKSDILKCFRSIEWKP